MAGADVREKFDQAVQKSRNKELRELFQYGLGCHHAGMLRSDRSVALPLIAAAVLAV
jgi:replicative superfamily II helicase